MTNVTHNENMHHDMTVGDLEKELIGRTITGVDEQEKTLTLDDGTILKFEDTYDCCAWFEAELTAGNLTDNAITALTVTERETEWGSEKDYTIHVLAANKNICDVSITGDATSGYYCHSINLRVRKSND